MISGYVLVDSKTGTRHPLTKETLIGRVTGDILLSADPRVSSKHCKLVFTPAGLTIEDLKSSNGTSVNGAKLNPHQPMLLEPGAQITLGGTTFELVHERPPVNAPPQPASRTETKSSFSPTRLLGALLIVGAAGLGVLAWKQQRAPAKKKGPSTIAEIATQPTTIDLYMQTSSEEFDRLTTTYAKLIDAVNVDGTEKQAAVLEIKTGLEPLCRRLLDETRKIKPASEADRVYINLHQKILFAMHQHMTAMMAYWESGDALLEKEANKSLTEYLEASRQMRIYLENR